jgi:hypothetical protein
MRAAFKYAIVLSLAATSWSRSCSTSREFDLPHPQTLSGTFVDPAGAVLGGIDIQVLSGKKTVQELRTSTSGTYDFGTVPAGRYRIRIKYAGDGFCAPQIECSTSGCIIKPTLTINPKTGMLVR